MDYSNFGNKRRRRELNSQTTRVRNKIALLVLRITLAVTLIGGFTLGAVGLGLWLGIVQARPEMSWDDISPGVYSSLIICARTGEELFVLHGGENRTFVTLEQVSPHLVNAIVAIEDERFWQHNGVDFRGMVRALRSALFTDGGTQGASTITQQLIKNIQGFFEGELVWKLQEQALAVQMERELTYLFGCRILAKEYILEMYLNTVSFGRQNYGVQAASMFYFGIDAAYLDIGQSAVIAAITQSPYWNAPDLYRDRNWRRAQDVLRNMHRLGYIDDEEFFEAMNSDVYATMIRDGSTMAVISTMTCYHDALVAQVRDDLMALNGWSPAMAYSEIFTGGLRIYSLQDLEMQEVVDRHFMNPDNFPAQDFRIHVDLRLTVRCVTTGDRTNHNPTYLAPTLEEAYEFKERMRNELVGTTDEIISERYFHTLQPQAAFVLIDHHTGHVLAMRGIRGEKQASRAFCRATEALRSPGSQLKPLAAFFPAFDMHLMVPSTVIEDIPLFIIDPYGVEERNHRVTNWYRTPYPYEGLNTARRAIYRSGNVTSTRTVMETVGIHSMWQYMQQLGFTTLVENEQRGRNWFTDRTYGLPLGSMTDGVRLIELAAAYAAVANGGAYNRPILYSRVVDRNGNVILENHHEPRVVMRPTTAYMLIDTMIDTVTLSAGTGGRMNWVGDAQMRRDIPIAGKTGTSEANRDLGFTGFTPYLTAAVWLGNDNNQSMSTRTVQGMGHASLYHGPLWRNIMQEIHEWERFTPRQFERPPGIITAEVCLDSGKLGTDLCRRDPRGNRVRTELFTAFTLPDQYCAVHQEHWVCVTHDTRYVAGALAHSGCAEAEMRVGLVRTVPIPEEFAHVNIRDRQWEHHPGVRHGQTCETCAPPAANWWENQQNQGNLWGSQDDWWNHLPGANQPPVAEPDPPPGAPDPGYGAPGPGAPDPDYGTPAPPPPLGGLWP